MGWGWGWGWGDVATPAPTPLRVISLYSGAFCAFFHAIRSLGHEAELVAIAEMDDERRNVLGDAYHVPEACRFKLATDAAARFTGGAAVLAASPSCRLLSKSRRVASSDWWWPAP